MLQNIFLTHFIFNYSFYRYKTIDNKMTFLFEYYNNKSIFAPLKIKAFRRILSI